MAAANFFTLLDDIATILDDVAVMSKVAAKKTVGVLGDDIALNAHQVSDFSASRELPVVAAVAKGSAINKAILVPIALALVAFAPWLITPLLMIGGAYLCFEGVEKIMHSLLHSEKEEKKHHKELVAELQMTQEEILASEKDKIKGAIRTDFILSAEIVAISLGTMQGKPLLGQAIALVIISIIFTIGVYAFVGGVVKLDDIGLYLYRKGGRIRQFVGQALLHSAPLMMRGLTFVGTAAMFLVGGGIISHGVPAIEPLSHIAVNWASSLPFAGAALAAILPYAVELVVGIIVGGTVLAAMEFYGAVRSIFSSNQKK